MRDPIYINLDFFTQNGSGQSYGGSVPVGYTACQRSINPFCMGKKNNKKTTKFILSICVKSLL